LKVCVLSYPRCKNEYHISQFKQSRNSMHCRISLLYYTKEKSECLSASDDGVNARFIASTECGVVKVMRQKVSWRFNSKKNQK